MPLKKLDKKLGSQVGGGSEAIEVTMTGQLEPAKLSHPEMEAWPCCHHRWHPRS